MKLKYQEIFFITIYLFKNYKIILLNIIEIRLRKQFNILLKLVRTRSEPLQKIH